MLSLPVHYQHYPVMPCSWQPTWSNWGLQYTLWLRWAENNWKKCNFNSAAYKVWLSMDLSSCLTIVKLFQFYCDSKRLLNILVNFYKDLFSSIAKFGSIKSRSCQDFITSMAPIHLTGLNLKWKKVCQEAVLFFFCIYTNKLNCQTNIRYFMTWKYLIMRV